MDQVPLPFVLDSSRSLNSIGKPVFIKVPHGSGLDKRQATIQLTIRAGGGQVVRVGLIFRGKGVRPKAVDMKMYKEMAGVVQVYFQPNAWADERVMLKWFDEFHEDTKDLGLREVSLGMDNQFRARVRLYNIVPAYTPPDCTDVVVPCDHHVGVHLKRLVGALYHMDMEKNPPTTGGLEAFEWRILMAQWTAARKPNLSASRSSPLDFFLRKIDRRTG
jgi:hypothetical protein